MKNIKKVLIIDPYLDSLGGGERHILSIGKVFLEKGFDVHVAWEDISLSPALKDRFGWENPDFLTNFWKVSPLERMKILSHYDYLFYVTDGSYFFSTAKKNYVFSMYPKKELYLKTPVNTLKWRNYSFICNSEFTRKYIANWTGKQTEVLYPYIDQSFIDGYRKSHAKEPIILSVGRFFNHLHTKNHEFIIDSFNKLQQNYPKAKEMQLYLAGGLQESDHEYYTRLVTLSKKNKNIHLCPNLPQNKLLTLFQQAMFYWHGAGYGAKEDELEKVEHFGITPVEAMASGCVVFSHNSGGQKEVITSEKNGFLYTTQEELLEKTIQLSQNKEERKKIGQEAHEYVCAHFTYDVFFDKVCHICGI